MTADEFLSQIEKYDTLIDGKLNERQKLWCLATKVTASFDREAVQTSGISDKVGDIGAKLVDIEREIDEMVDLYIDIQKDCIRVIERLSNKPLMYKVLHKHYVEYMSYTEIAEEEHYSYTWIMEIRDRALQEVDKILQEKSLKSKKSV